MSGVHHIHADTWRIPPDTKLPSEICEEATRGGEYSRQPLDEDDALIELRKGLVMIRTLKPGPGRCSMHLIPADQHGPNAAPAWSLEDQPDNSGAETLQYIPVTEEIRDRAIRPGLYRIQVQAETDWSFRWIQPQPGTGHVDIIEEELREAPGLSEPGLYSIGPHRSNLGASQTEGQTGHQAADGD